jgi:hypothetical protein
MRLFSRRPTARTATRPTCLQLRSLEDRTVPAMTLHSGPGFPHGALLRHVDVQNVYLGDGWAGSPDRTADILKFENFAKFATSAKAGYLGQLSKARYGVGAGKAEAGVVVENGTLSSGAATISDATIQADLQAMISAGTVQPTNANRLYMVYVQPNTEVTTTFGNSEFQFVAYHSAFSGTGSNGKPAAIFYAVMPYQGTGVNAQNPDVIPNPLDPSNPTFVPLVKTDSITAAASHELIEAATDAVPTEGWFDDGTQEEIGDTVNSEDMILGGFVLQKQGDKTGGDSALPLPKGAINYAYFSGVVQPPATAVSVPPLGEVPGSPTLTFGPSMGASRPVTDPSHSPDQSAWDPSTLYLGTQRF